MLEKVFSRFASAASRWADSPTTFAAVAVVVAWALSGPAFGFSDVWQLTINTGTTTIIFLIVFLIQNSQNRDTRLRDTPRRWLFSGTPSLSLCRTSHHRADAQSRPFPLVP
jgi:Low affinity iron permease